MILIVTKQNLYLSTRLDEIIRIESLFQCPRPYSVCEKKTLGLARVYMFSYGTYKYMVEIVIYLSLNIFEVVHCIGY